MSCAQAEAIFLASLGYEDEAFEGAEDMQAPDQNLPTPGRSLILPLNSPFSDPPCSVHGDQQESMYCRTCSKLMCAACLVTDHQDHKFTLAQAMKDEMKDRLAQEISALRDQAAKCAANEGSLKDRLQEAEAGLKTERRLLTDRRAAAEAGLREQRRAAVELIDEDLEARLKDLKTEHARALAQAETIWGEAITEVKSAISSRDQAGKASAKVIAETKDIADTPCQLEAARASVAQVRADVPDVTTPAALPAPSPDSQLAHLAELHVKVVSADYLASLKSLEEEKKAEEERRRREEAERRPEEDRRRREVLEERKKREEAERKAEEERRRKEETDRKAKEECRRREEAERKRQADVQKELKRLLREKPNTSGDVGHITVPMAVYKSWEVTAGNPSARPLPLQWPEDSAPLRWACNDVTVSAVVFLPPDEARRVVALVGGRDLLARQVFNDCAALVAEDDTPRYVNFNIYDKRGGRMQTVGHYLLPATWTVRAALTGVLGTAPHAVTDGGDAVELGQTCLERRICSTYSFLYVNK